ncbi:MAG: hypothetical protein INQ03_02695 [Candidatus Heimdallarchaeota archaeon]|nr:hypothetical protein [Candidatus Heimdallarchaeota archaeon]
MDKLEVSKVFDSEVKVKILHALYTNKNGMSKTSLSTIVNNKLSEVRDAVKQLLLYNIVIEDGRKFVINEKSPYSKQICLFFDRWSRVVI